MLPAARARGSLLPKAAQGQRGTCCATWVLGGGEAGGGASASLEACLLLPLSCRVSWASFREEALTPVRSNVRVVRNCTVAREKSDVNWEREKASVDYFNCQELELINTEINGT